MTSVLQSYSRTTKISIDRLAYAFEFKNIADPVALTQGPEFGCLVYGLYSEAARFDMNKMVLMDNPPGVMHSEAPVIYFNPKENHKVDPHEYQCPLYKTLLRSGTLSATGASTNFVLNISCPSKFKPEYWILNGAAFICALNY